MHLLYLSNHSLYEDINTYSFSIGLPILFIYGKLYEDINTYSFSIGLPILFIYGKDPNLKDKYPNFEVGLKCILMVIPYLILYSYIKEDALLTIAYRL